MVFPPATPYTPEALLRRFIKLFYALGLEHASHDAKRSFELWFRQWWMSLFTYGLGVRRVPWYDARWWRMSEEDRKEVFNKISSWELEVEAGRLTLEGLPYPSRMGINTIELTKPKQVAQTQGNYPDPDILRLILRTPEDEIFGVLPKETLAAFRRAIRPSDYDPDALGGEAHALGHSVFGRYSHRQRAIYGL